MAAAILLTGCASQSIEPPVPNTNAPIWFPSALAPALPPMPPAPAGRPDILPPNVIRGMMAAQPAAITRPHGTNFPAITLSWQDVDPSIVMFVVFGGRKDGTETFTHTVMAPTNSLAIQPFNGPAWFGVEAVGFDGMTATSSNIYIGVATNWPAAVPAYEENGVCYVGFMATAGFTWFLARTGSTNWLWSDTPTNNRLEQVPLPAPWPASYRVCRTQ